MTEGFMATEQPTTNDERNPEKCVLTDRLLKAVNQPSSFGSRMALNPEVANACSPGTI